MCTEHKTIKQTKAGRQTDKQTGRGIIRTNQYLLNSVQTIYKQLGSPVTAREISYILTLTIPLVQYAPTFRNDRGGEISLPLFLSSQGALCPNSCEGAL